MRAYRDDVLLRTPAGKAYTDLYYRHSPELIRIVIRNPVLLRRIPLGGVLPQQSRSALPPMRQVQPS
jgi:hypothetical protein